VTHSAAGADVLVIGGGPAGAAAAIALRRAGAEVMLLERSDDASPRIGEAVPPAIGPALSALGVELALGERHLRAWGTCAAWGSDALGYNDFLRSAEGPGWHLDRARFDRDLLDAARARGVTVRLGASLAGAEPARGSSRGGAPGFVLHTRAQDGGGRLDARFVVDATGRRAAFATAAGASRVYFDDLVAVTAVFSLGARMPGAAPGDGFAVIESAEDLWWYYAVTPGRRAVVACLSDADRVKAGRLFDAEEWIRRLGATRHIGPRISGAAGRSALSLHSARTQALDRPFGEGWIAAGDAAASYDPLSSAGIVNALRSGLDAAGAVAAHFSGEAGALEAYARGVERALDIYLEGRRRYYAAERRWPDAPFWRRRRAEVTLAPRARLRLVETAEARRALSRCAAHLPPADLRRIGALCAEPRSAAQVVAALREEGRARADRRAIAALQSLVERGILEAAGEPVGGG
jgi:flavin-dependent dehydrogenase